ncbi:hypothetical protein TH25_25530 [Thalassospira profundimaris]|uniref:Uncharacterized protein n=1 Tax=Thalassospira profundimaris TaxID=502049 RepID=A0A367WDN5_9PROT|nr:hypothetical protein [Thalassospira profundimaris]RCK38632.1 hypothetical protein TH25_25530 [Thalassospira profundimaris]
MAEVNSSSGHKLGQLVGDWFEEYFVCPLLKEVAESLNLYADSRFNSRACRGHKIIWEYLDSNEVDYDAVLEINGTNAQKGIPVAFIECFWRRGSRHSKDKARDDSGKLMPMRDTYPSARFLGIIAAGDFTAPARELVMSRGIDLFYIPKAKIVESFNYCGLTIDYDDKSTEYEKDKIARSFIEGFSAKEKRSEVATTLINLVGKNEIENYITRVRARLSSSPQEIRIILRQQSIPIRFESTQKVALFLNDPDLSMRNPAESFVYEISYSDGSEFSKEVTSMSELKELHKQISTLEKHMIGDNKPPTWSYR